MSAPEILYPPGTVVHDDGTIDSQPCASCKLQTLSFVEYECGGDVYAALFMCRGCQAVAASEVEELRAIFNGYVAEGMSKETADKAMTRWHVRIGGAR